MASPLVAPCGRENKEIGAIFFPDSITALKIHQHYHVDSHKREGDFGVAGKDK
jgi:hypothetical protein